MQTKNSDTQETKTKGITFDDVLTISLSRRNIMKGGVGLAVSSLLAGCGNGSDSSDASAFLADQPGGGIGARDTFTSLNFSSISTSDADYVTVPEGHVARVLYAVGDPLNSSLADYSNVGAEAGEEFDFRAGDHHDGMYFFGMDADGNLDINASDRGILCLNHENITQALLHPSGPSTDEDGNRLDVDEVRKEQRAHGVTCVEVRRDAEGQFSIVKDSAYNRRITANTPMDLMGPIRGTSKAYTKYSHDGTKARGTLNNCANGYTPWGTYLTCEENFDLYFRDDRNLDRSNSNPETLSLPNFLSGVGVRVPSGLYGWATLAGHADEIDDEFTRFNVTPGDIDPSMDYRNESNQFGYIVEIDPFDPTSTPRKRTALGRFAHEGVWPSNIEVGQPVTFYMGDDDQLQYIYKFVSDAIYEGPVAGESPLDTGNRYMDSGTLYVARFDPAESTGTMRGEWLPLVVDNPDLAATNGADGQFPGAMDSDAWILLNARAAAFAAGGTPMDRPEWGAVNQNGEVYFTLTNNSDRRSFDDLDPIAAAAGDEGSRDEVTEYLADREFGAVAANPRGPNSDGHIIRLREDNDDPAATAFEWDIFLFGAGSDDDADTNRSGLTPDNEFTDADGLWFDRGNLMWIQTDGGQPNGNNQMLAALVGEVGDGGITADNNADNLRRFLVGPIDCEITGISITPDKRSMFINVQHPGDDAELGDDGNFIFNGNWPNDNRDATQIGDATTRPRSATIVITREDGGVLGVDG